MERTRTTLFWLLVMSLTLLAAVPPSVAAEAATATPAAPAADPLATAPAIAAASEPSCDSCALKCPCGCSPLAGAWVAKLSSPRETVIQTFKFAPINDECTKFVVNSQASTRSAKVTKAWPEACDLTDFVGVACKAEWGKIQFTAIGYGVKRCDGVDKVQFIAIMTAQVDLPASCLECDSTDADGKYNGPCKEPDELGAIVYVSYFDAAQDEDHDGFPDCECDEAVICVCYETKLKRVKLIEPCAESKSFIACLEKYEDCNTPATGRVFLRILEGEQKICFVVTVKSIKNVTRAAIQVGGKDVAPLFPFPPATGSRDGDCDGLLSCGCFYVKDCIGTWRNKKFTDIVKAIEDCQATVVVSTRENPHGEICGAVEDP